MWHREWLAGMLIVALAAPAHPKKLKPEEQKIQDRDTGGNGIIVDSPKVYDDSLLQQMLQAAQARLAALQVIDAAGIAKGFGAISGASLASSSFGLSIQGAPIPQVVTANKGATGSTVGTVGSTGSTTGVAGYTGVTGFTGPSGNQAVGGTYFGSSTGVTNTIDTTQTTTGQATTDRTVTAPQFNVPTATAPAATAAMPGSMGVSASDLLNEQMQLTYEIANLRLLLEGALNDRLIRSEETYAVKPRTTIGFPITLRPDKRFKNAVAVVEVEATTTGDTNALYNSEPPAVTALLPREKTYNVAAITDRNTSIGGGIVTQVIGIGFNYSRGRKTHYVVQDQDTLALPVATEKTMTSFAWHFRPVLGQEFVRSGMKQTFVQLAFPTKWSAKSYGSIKISSYWRKFDVKTGLAGDVIAESLREHFVTSPWVIPNLAMEQYPQGLKVLSVEDAGAGQLLLAITGRFLTGTQVRIGATLLGDANGPNFTMQHRLMRFLAPAYSLATDRVAIVTRDGTETELTFPEHCPEGADPKDWGLTSGFPSISRLDDGQAKVTFKFTKELPSQLEQRLYIVTLGDRAFGPSNNPLEWKQKEKELSFHVPNAVLLTARRGKIKQLFSRYGSCEFPFTLEGLGKEAQPERLVLLSQTKEAAKFAIYGSRLKDLEVISPKVSPGDLKDADKDSVRTLEFQADDIKAHKQIVLKRSNEGPFLIPMPVVEFKEAAKPQAKAKERAVLNDDELVLAGEGLDKVERIFWGDKEVKFEKSADKGKTLKLVKLKSVGLTTTTATKDITLYLDSGKLTVPIEVVEKRIEAKN